MLSHYLTIKHDGSSEQTIHKSRFIGHVKRVETKEAAEAFIQYIKTKHPSATHHCSAFLIGEQDNIQKANDDGEPSGTAGIPILEVLKKKELKNTVVVITRYFGGIKLGAGGLIRAYGGTTSQVIQDTGIVRHQLMQLYTITIDYTMIGKIKNEIQQTNYHITDIQYTDKVNICVSIQIGDEDQFEGWIINLTNNQIVMTKTVQQYIDINV